MGNGETLFVTGNVCTRMLFVLTRPMFYELAYVDNSTAVESVASAESMTEDPELEDECIVEPGDWISEAALWTEWQNCGELRAMDTCAVVAVDAHTFSETLRDHTT